MNSVEAQQMARPIQDAAIITPDMLPEDKGNNINGPSLIRVPAWVEEPLGKYYLYFGHHSGKYIRLAYADDLKGPWKIHKGGVLKLEQVKLYRDHLASPDVIIDEKNKRILMYHHGPLSWDLENPLEYHKDYQGSKLQISALAVSNDGLNFISEERVLAPYYMRAFTVRGELYAMAWGGQLHRWDEKSRRFQPGHFPIEPFLDAREKEKGLDELVIRHVAIDQNEQGKTWAYFSCIGDKPEQIYRVRILTEGPWTTWKAEKLEEVRKPVRAWEGGQKKLKVSKVGAAKKEVRELRDPAIFREDGRVFLIYSIKGEKGLGIAEIFEGSEE